jgi:CBS domain containing-hemolysin-like protein
MIWKIALVLFLVLANAFFVAAEFALVKLRLHDIKLMAQHGARTAKTVEKIMGKLDTYLSACQLGVTLASLGLGWAGEPLVAHGIQPAFVAFKIPEQWTHLVAFPLAFLLITLIHITAGEQVPKIIAIERHRRSAQFVSLPLVVFYTMFKPFIWVINSISNGMLQMMGIKLGAKHGQSYAQEEIRHLVLEGSIRGSIKPFEHELLHHALDFSDIIARQIMTPRPDIAAINLKDDLETILRTIREEGYSRYPVFEETIDQITGVLYTKDIIHLMIDAGPIILHDLVRPAMFVPDSMPIAQVLNRFQAEHMHLAMVLDEFGGTAGLVTIEDILEEIVGEIQDEYDVETEDFRVLDDGSALVEGSLAVIDFNDHFDADLPTDRADTMAGLITATLDRLPKLGDSIVLDSVRLEVAAREKRRIRLLRAKKIDTADRTSDGNTHPQ